MTASVGAGARKRLVAVAGLIVVAAVWGGTFVMVKDAVSRYPVYTFLTLRFAIATLAFVGMFPSAVRRLDAPVLRVGVLAGILLCAGYVFQTWGLQDTTASKAAFVTGMFVVITPMLQAIVLRSQPRRSTLVGVALAVVGLSLLSEASVGGWTIGDTRVLLCAIAYAAHMVVLGGAGRHHDPVPLTLVQLAVVAVACGTVALAVERAVAPPPDVAVWFALAVTGVFASAIAFGVQTFAQRHISPTKTALVLILEPVFGGVFGWLAGDAFGPRALAGSGLILGGMVVSEVFGAVPSAREHVVVPSAPEGLPVPLLEPDVTPREPASSARLGPSGGPKEH